MNHRTYERAIVGDDAAVLIVVDSLRPRIARMASYYARRCGEDPDDLLQEAWLGMLDSLPLIDLAIGAPDQFLIQRARWRLLDAVKRSRVRRCAALEEVPERSTTPEMLDRACVADFAAGLSPAQRRILAHLLAGFTWRETGTALRCTSPNVAYHVRQIRRRYVEWSGERGGSLPPAPAAAIG